MEGHNHGLNPAVAPRGRGTTSCWAGRWCSDEMKAIRKLLYWTNVALLLTCAVVFAWTRVAILLIKSSEGRCMDLAGRD